MKTKIKNKGIYGALMEDALRVDAITIKGRGGTPELTAHLNVSNLLGHERPDVTDILASVRKGGRLGD